MLKCWLFVTGATGFVGSHVARALAAQGADLRLLIRSSSDLRNIQELQAEQVVGDLRDAASLKKAVAGCDVVFHVAADYRLWVRDPEQMYRSNVEGTKAILEAARENKVRRVVYTSSVATMGFQSNGHLANEDSPVSLANMIGPYKRSKFMAEEIAIEAGKSGMDVVVVNPTTPVGERDIKPTPTGRIVVDFLKKKFPAYVDTGLNLVDVAECARGHVAALEKGKSGERYILGGENLTLKQILDKLAAITGLPSPKIKVPYVVALATGVVDQVVTGYIRNREPRATIDAVRMGRKKMFVSSSKAERDLGWKTVPVDDALRRAVEWFQANGYASSSSRVTGHRHETVVATRQSPRARSGSSQGSARGSVSSCPKSTAKVAIVAALEREVRPLIKQWRPVEREHDGRKYKFFENERAVLVCGGIGPEAARRATEAIINLYAPVLVQSAGFAGALDPTLKVGTVLTPICVIDAKDGSRIEAGVGYWVLVSVDQPASVKQKAKLAEAYWAHAVDMEAAAVARAAQAHDITFVGLKAISDEADFEMPPMERFIASDGQFRTGHSPPSWPSAPGSGCA